VSLSQTNQATVRVTGINQSQSQGDVRLRLLYTINNQSADWEGTLSVIRPKNLTRLTGQESFDPTGKTCPGGLTSYLRTVRYRVNSQLAGVVFSGYDAWLEESYANLIATPNGCVPTDIQTEPGTLIPNISQITDIFSFCGANCGAACQLTGKQTIKLNGYVVRINDVTWTCSDVSITQASGSP
jgi:hypothetical protein